MILQISTLFGRGIALQAKPDISQAVSIAQRNIETKAATQAATRAAQQKEYDKYAKDMQNFDIDPKFDPYFTKPLQLAGAKVREAAMEARNVNPHANYRNTDKFQKAYLEFLKEEQNATIGTSILKNVKETVVKNPKGLVIGENNKILAEAYQTGNFEEARAILGKVPTSEQLITYQAPEVNLLQDLRLNLSPLFERAKETGKISIAQPDGSIKTVTTTELTEQDAFNLANVNLTNPDILNSVKIKFARLSPEAQEQFRTPENWYREAFVKPFIDTEIGTTLTKPVAKKEKVTEANIQQNKVYQTKGGTVTSSQSISLGTGTKRYNLTGKVTVFNEETGEEIDIQKNGVTLQDFARLPFVSSKIIQPLIEKGKLSEFTYFKAIDSYFITNEEVLDKIPKDKIKYKNVMTGMAKPAEEEWEIGTVGTIPTIILFDNQESFLRKNFPDEHKLFLNTIKKGGAKEPIEKEITTITTQTEYDALPTGAKYKDSAGTIGIK